MNDLFEYLSYHRFLEDYLTAKRAEKEWFSLRWFAQRIEVDQGNPVRVFQGKRHLSDAAVDRLVAFLDLDGRRAEYLRTLVQFNKARTDAKARVLFDQLMAIAAPEAKVLAPKQYEFYRKWYHTAVYNLMDYYDFRGNFEELAKLTDPPLTVPQAKESVELLLRLGLLSVRSDGRHVQTHDLISSGSEWRSLAVQAFQEETLRLAMHSLEHHPRASRDFSTLTMSLAGKDLEKVRGLMVEFRKSLLKIVQESEPADSVYHLNMHFFPMTRLRGGRHP